MMTPELRSGSIMDPDLGFFFAELRKHSQRSAIARKWNPGWRLPGSRGNRLADQPFPPMLDGRGFLPAA